MFCRACGNEVLDTTVICPKCGSYAIGTPPQTNTQKIIADEAFAPIDKRLLIAGYATAVIFPLQIIAFIIAIIVMQKKNLQHGAFIAIVAGLGWSFWTAVINWINTLGTY